MFIDDQVIVVDSEDAVQISLHKLEIFTSKYGLKFPKSRTKTVTFKGRNPARSKIVINYNSIGKRAKGNPVTGQGGPIR
jgi:hypothetical protein